MEMQPDTLAVPVPCASDWSELPVDALSLILGKLGAVEILMNAGLVCHSWLAAAKMPHLWREVDIGRGPRDKLLVNKGIFAWVALSKMIKMAVDRSDGKMDKFVGEGFVDSALLIYIAERSTSLKSLRIIRCYNVSSEGFAKAIKNLPLLMELEVSLCLQIGGIGNRVFDIVGIACPCLRRFRYCMERFYIVENMDTSEDEKAQAIATMSEIRSLQLFAIYITNEGLVAILDNCHKLESLDIRHCFGINMDDHLAEKFARIKTLKLPF